MTAKNTKNNIKPKKDFSHENVEHVMIHRNVEGKKEKALIEKRFEKFVKRIILPQIAHEIKSWKVDSVEKKSEAVTRTVHIEAIKMLTMHFDDKKGVVAAGD